MPQAESVFQQGSQAVSLQFSGEGILTMLQDSYLLRFWRTPQAKEWRITLIAIGPENAELHFVSIEALTRHLHNVYQAPDVLTNPEKRVDEIGRLGD